MSGFENQPTDNAPADSGGILKWIKKSNKRWEAAATGCTYYIFLEDRIYWPRVRTRSSMTKFNGKLTLQKAKEVCEDDYKAQFKKGGQNG